MQRTLTLKKCYVKVVGAPNNRMFPNTSQVSKAIFSRLLKASLVNFKVPLLLGSNWDVFGELWPSRRVCVPFPSHPKLLANLMGPGDGEAVSF